MLEVLISRNSDIAKLLVKYIILDSFICEEHHLLLIHMVQNKMTHTYRGADKSLARPTSHCILFDG
jgi:hypothetical protein